ncbi:uncharacterized protein LOC108900338 [Lates japonicus]
MKMRDIEFEARRLLSSPETIPLQFQHPKIIGQAQKYARTLAEQHQEAPNSKLLGPREVVIEVVPKVMQGFWLPPPNTSLNMPSQKLSKMGVGLTKAVEDQVTTALSTVLRQVTFSRSIRDDMVLTILGKVRQSYSQDILVKKLNCFTAEILTPSDTITDTTAAEICELFEPQIKVSVNMKAEKNCTQAEDVVDGAEAKTGPAEDQSEEPGLEEDTEPIRELDSAVATPPPAPLITAAELPADTATQNNFISNLDEAEEQPTPSPLPDSAVVSPPVTALLTSSTEPPATIGSDKQAEQPTSHLEPEPAVVPTLTLPAHPPASASVPARLTPPNEAPVTTEQLDKPTISQAKAKIQTGRGTQGFFGWFRKALRYCFLLEDTERH